MSKFIATFALLVAWSSIGLAIAAEPRSNSDNEAATIDASGFRDGAHHWRNIRDDKRVIHALPDQPKYEPAQFQEIAANIVLFQRANGGWPKDYDMLAVLTDEQRDAIRATRDRTDTSFDNYNIHSQVDYLARANASEPNPTWREACTRGFDFLLEVQMPNGGFPQRYPGAESYGKHITFNDGVMVGILNVLKDAADGQPHWAWLDEPRRERASAAVDRGVECILKCQIRVNRTLTGWCQQHDENTFEAASARTFELASICPQETTSISRFLMRFDEPSDEMIAAIEAARVWLEQSRLSGVRVERVPAPDEEFIRHRANFDVVVVDDSEAPPIWARHYEIGTNRPVFAGRDAVKRYALREIERERRTGTPWYGNWPTALLEGDYPAWKQKLASRGD